ncbi:ribonuclease P protein component [Maritimibacter dapengensis]|uniref:Ribonuclease P protein component n=1 Tax=Maritimibacter dapengensis TaxID=2836868 RepID=A0ABS6T5S3_9RHOB|nr:ribonuclease P protein component [Maritimibacter dapengensis]MBV7380573.1 ribonuclease P protein component [Maritimibacter dapengensis]
MTPPEAPGTDRKVATTETPPAVSRLQILRKRSDFLACAKGRKAPAPGFLLQGRNRSDDDPNIQVGFTASKKIGNAVARNRAKRRLRALAQDVIAAQGRPGWDYVLVARPGETVSRDFDAMRWELETALSRLHGA